MNINPIIIELLSNRGISSPEDIEEFLSEKPKKTYDPFLLLNMEAGVDLIMSAINDNKKICVYGDYDADGITATTLMMQVLSKATTNLAYYIPSRFDEGYGLNQEAIKTIKDQGSQMIITVDCGSVSAKEVEYAKSLGLDILITDHHTITDRVADCLLINPKQSKCTYPYKELAGVGVAFKLAQALSIKGAVPREVLSKVLDLVAVGTVGDIVPLLDENRTLVKFGLRAVNLSNRRGLRELITGISLRDTQIKSQEIAFGIVPHLNAAGRMKDASIAVKLLLKEDEMMVADAVKELIQCNKERKHVQEITFKHCMESIGKEAKEKEFLVVYAGDAHEGITGIVAGKIKEIYNKPTIILTPSGDYYKGTGRSIEGVNLYNLLKKHEKCFVKFGGHAAACGFLMKKEYFNELKDGLDSDMREILKNDPSIGTNVCQSEMVLRIPEITLELLAEIDMMAPFGSKNNRPVFAINKVTIQDTHVMGVDGTHARFIARDENGNSLKCVLFRKAKEYDKILTSNNTITIMGAIECQEWKNTRTVQMIVESIQ